MRVFVTGATGALGRHLVPGLVAAGHEVTATTRTPGKVGQLREAGAEPVVLDGLDREAVIAAVRAAAPEVIVHQMTALADMRSLRNPDQAVRRHQRAPDQGHRQPAGGRGAGGHPPGHRAELRGLDERAFRRAGEDRGRPARLRGPSGRRCRRSAAIKHVEETVPLAGAGGHRAALRQLLRAGRLGCPAGHAAEAAAAGDRRRDRDLVVHRDHRRRGRDARRGRAAARPASTTSWTATRRRSRSGCRTWPRSRARSRRCGCPPGSGGCSPGSSSWPR